MKFTTLAVAMLLWGTTVVVAQQSGAPVSGTQDWQAASAAELAPRHSVPKVPVRALAQDRLLASPIPYERRLMVKFVDGALVRADDGRPVSRVGRELALLQALALELDLTFAPLIRLPEGKLRRLEQRAALRSGTTQPDLAGMLRVNVPGADVERLEAVGDRLAALAVVEFAYVQTLGAPPPGDIAPVTPNLEFNQGYRGPNPGLDSDWAAGIGLTGAGIGFFDCEYGWVLSHEDLEDVGILTEPGQTTHPQVANNSWDEHGTAVLGEICASSNAYGITGMAPGAQIHAYTEWSVEEGLRRVTCVANAVADAAAGDVVLLEMQSGSGAPVETDPSMFTVVKVGTDAGVIVVAAAGNGNEDLDGLGYSFYQSLGDSGAILVGAGSADVQHEKLSFSSYGTRLNVQGWGEDVFTTGYGFFAEYGGDKNQRYTSSFSGTSSAAPFVASAALLVQQMVEDKLERRFDSLEMRGHLAATGTPQGGVEGNIGPFLNMNAAVNDLPDGPWTDEGCALAGAAGLPLLAGTGPLQFGSTGSVDLTNAAPTALAVMFVSFSSTPAAAFGGTLKPIPIAAQIVLITNASGEVLLPYTWNFNFPVGFNMWIQYAIEDPGAFDGVALSNALRLTTQ